MNFKKECVKKFESTIMEFVNKKKISVKDDFYRAISDGGLGGPNIWAKLKGAQMNWILRLIRMEKNPPEFRAPWMTNLTNILKSEGCLEVELIVECGKVDLESAAETL